MKSPYQGMANQNHLSRLSLSAHCCILDGLGVQPSCRGNAWWPRLRHCRKAFRDEDCTFLKCLRKMFYEHKGGLQPLSWVLFHQDGQRDTCGRVHLGRRLLEAAGPWTIHQGRGVSRRSGWSWKILYLPPWGKLEVSRKQNEERKGCWEAR